jgi:pantoate--beta-alanine ligase
MGAFHQGHLSLMRLARRTFDAVVTSIFVNPTQFAPHEDFEGYPRDEEGDLEACRNEGIDVAFVPSVPDMYPPGSSTRIDCGELATIVEGAQRPGHFDGVCTVVARLFNLVAPTSAVFGQKDAQQIAVVRRMCTDLGFQIDIIAAPTVREHDGLAWSSRNTYLTPEQRLLAPALFQALTLASEGAGADPRRAESLMEQHLEEAGVADVDYALAVKPDDFRPATRGENALLVVAARFGGTRLIDNLPLAG